MAAACSNSAAASTDEQWVRNSPREEIAPAFRIEPAGGRGGGQRLVIEADDRPGLAGYWSKRFPIEGGQHYLFRAHRRVLNVALPRRSVYARIVWLNAAGKPALRDMPVVGPYHPPGKPEESTAEFPADGPTDAQGWTELAGVYRAPVTATHALVAVHLEWAPSASVEFSDIALTPCAAPAPRIVRLATVHYVPTGKVSPSDNCRQFAPLLAQAAQLRADLVVLPETLTQTGTGLPYERVAEAIPGPSTEYFGALAKQHKLHLVVGLIERDRNAVYNVAVLIGPLGQIIGKYRKVCLPRLEVEWGVAPGYDYPVFDTALGKIGMMVCYDGFFPEVARELANRGAEIIAFPVAGCNPQLVAARACENHVFLVSSTYTDVKANWTISAIYGRQGEILSQAKSWGSVAVAEVDLGQPTIWANLGDFRAQLLRHRPAPAPEQVAPARANPRPMPPSIHAKPLPSLRIPPREPAEALRSFRTQDGFRMDLLAAEPLVADPVALEYDEAGRAWVVEMSDYPYTDKSKDKAFTVQSEGLPLGRIRVLLDDDGDGRFERAVVFADGLSWPTGLAFWKGGVFVAATPNLWYLKDVDGDGKADVRRKIFTGFQKFNVQAVMNNLRWGLDHRIYGAGGTNGGDIVRVASPKGKSIRLGANDFRFDPIDERFETVAGGARFGLTFDDWGNRFGCNIRNPIRYSAMDDCYAARNPLLPIASLVQDVAAAGDTLPIFRLSPPEPWRILNARRLAADPTTPSPRSETTAAGYVTSACGVTIFRGNAYGSEYYGQAFLGEVAANVVHRQRLVAAGIGFRSERSDADCEFVASTDNWFRPVNFANAPDGALHVVDMYRETIEHPWSIPDDIKARLDLESGRDRGRIYRLTPPQFKPNRRIDLGRLKSVQLVEFLSHSNAWHRDTAFRLIYERQDRGCVSLLRRVLRMRPAEVGSNQSPDFSAIGRMLALRSLDGLESLTATDLEVALADPHAGVREHAVKLSEKFLTDPLGPLVQQVAETARDVGIRVRRQAALSLGDTMDSRAAGAIATIARRDPDDRWIQTAVLAASPRLASRILCEFQSDDKSSEPQPPVDVIGSLATVVGQRRIDAELAAAFDQIAGLPTNDSASLFGQALALGLGEGLQRKGTRLDAEARRFSAKAAARIAQWTVQARTRLADRAVSPAARVQAIRLAHQGGAIRAAELVDMLDASQPQDVQGELVRIVARTTDDAARKALLGRFRSLTPVLRAEVLQPLQTTHGARVLLEAIEYGHVPIDDLSTAGRAVLLRHSDGVIKAKTRAMLLKQGSTDRKQLIERYKASLAMMGDAARGQGVCRRVCLNCHRFAGTGKEVGPPLETVRHRAAEEVLLHVLDPNREVAPNYVDYVATLRSGRVASGVVVAETTGSVTLRRAEGVEETILRSDIEQLASTGKSIMPEGLEKQITVNEMADLIAYLLDSARPAPAQ